MPLPRYVTLPTTLPRIPFAKHLLAGCAAALLAAVVAPMFVDQERIKNTLTEHIAKATGLRVTAKIEGSISAFPSPRLQLADIELKDEARGTVVLAARQANVRLGWLGLFSAFMPDVELIAPTITLPAPRLSSSEIQSTVQTLCALPGTVTFQNGDIHIKNGDNAALVHAQYVNGTLQCTANALTLSLQGEVFDHPSTLHVSSGLQVGAPVSLAVATAQYNLSFTGTLPAADAQSTGELALRIASPAAEADYIEVNYDANPSAPPALTWLAATGKVTLGVDEMWLHRCDVTIGGAAGKLSMYAATRYLPTFAVDVEADTFDATVLTPLLTGLLSRSSAATADASEVVKEDRAFVALAHSNALTMGGHTLKDARVSLEYGGLDVPLHDVSATTEDGSVFTFQGRYTDRTLGARVEGKASLEGKSFKGFLATFEPAAANLPEADFGAYAVAGSVFLSREQFRVSEAEINVGQINLTGGLATYFENTPRVEADIRMKDVNLDYFRNSWRAAKQNASKDIYSAVLLSGGEFGWLKRLTSAVDLRLWFDGFTFLERTGEHGTVHVTAKSGELSFSGLELGLPEGKITGLATLNVENERPKLTLVVTAPFYNSNYTYRENAPSQAPWIDIANKEARFSKELFDFSWAAAMDGEFDINIGSFTLDNEDYGFLKTKGNIQNQQIRFQHFGLNLFGGQLSANGTLTGGKVPALSANFALYDTHLETLLAQLGLLDTLTGRANISGTVATSGIHFSEWVRQADMRIALTARGVHIPNFNLQGVLDTAQAARHTDDVVNGVDRMMRSGSSEFSVDGNINLAHGMFKTPGITLATATQTNGVLGGQIELMPWKMNLDIKFQFPQLSGVTVPNFGVNIVGPMDAYTIRTDTASLEAYVAKRIVGQ